MTSERHSKRYSPSAAHRWLECPGSVQMIQYYQPPDTETPAAAEGRLAHTLAAKSLTEGMPVEQLPAAARLFSRDVKHIQSYVDYVSLIVKEHTKKGVAPYTFYEKEMRFGDMDWWGEDAAMDMFGTPDSVIFSQMDNTLHVVDFKFGEGLIVNAEGNPQLLLYALGALLELDNKVDTSRVFTVCLHIYQPRAAGGHVSRWWLHTKPTDIMSGFRKEIVPVLAGIARVVTGDTDLKPGEVQCRFCPVKAQCPALAGMAEEVADVASNQFDPVASSDINLQIKILRSKKLIASYLQSLENYARSDMESGHDWPGLELKEGRRIRKWNPRDRSWRQLVAKHAPGRFMREIEYISPAEFARIAPQAALQAEQDGLIVVSRAKPTVAASSGD